MMPDIHNKATVWSLQHNLMAVRATQVKDGWNRGLPGLIPPRGLYNNNNNTVAVSTMFVIQRSPMIHWTSLRRTKANSWLI